MINHFWCKVWHSYYKGISVIINLETFAQNVGVHGKIISIFTHRKNGAFYQLGGCGNIQLKFHFTQMFTKIWKLTQNFLFEPERFWLNQKFIAEISGLSGKQKIPNYFRFSLFPQAKCFSLVKPAYLVCQ